VSALSRTAIVAAALLAAACTEDPVHIGPAAGTLPPRGVPREISASTCGFQFLLLIPIQTLGRYDRAYHDLLEKAGEDYVTDVQIAEDWWYIGVGNLYCTRMRARAIRADANAPPLPAASVTTAPVIASGPTAKLVPGAAVRLRPSLLVDQVPLEAGAKVRLGDRVLAPGGYWRHVTEIDVPHRSGWVLEQQLQDFNPPPAP